MLYANMSLFRFGFTTRSNLTTEEASAATDNNSSDVLDTPVDAEPANGDRDPAMPTAGSLDEEVRLGPVVMRSDITRRGRGFRSEWTTSRPWLEYSSSADKAFCFPCRLFAKTMTATQTKGHDAFASKGFDSWKHALSKDRGFANHEASEVHQTCVEMLSNRTRQLNDMQGHPSIEACLSAAFRERQLQREVETQRNRKYIGRLSDVMRLLMRLGLAARGHRASAGSLHRGNFVELVNMLRNSDDFLDSEITRRPGNAHYMSPECQNQLIEAIGSEVLCTIADSARSADYFAVIMDETTDLAHMEQIAVVVRFCDSEFNAFERLISLTESPSVTGQHLADILLSTLRRHRLDTGKLCAQTYDGGASMSGNRRGVQALIKQTAPQAHYNHCRSHSCNLVIVKSVQASRFGRNFFGVLEQLFVIIEGSAKRHSWFMEAQNAAGLRAKPLKALSDTRWNCQGRSVEVVRSRLSAVNETLERIRDETSDRKVIGEAVGLLAWTTTFEFAVAIVFFAKLLSPLDTLTTAIQGPDATLDTVVSLSHAASQCLTELRDNLDAVLTSAVELANNNGIDSQFQDKRPRKVSRRLDAGKNETVLSAGDEVKREMTEAVDMALCELKSRFGDNASKLYELVGKLMDPDTTTDELHTLISMLYPDFVDADEAVAQFDIVRRLPAWTRAVTLQQRAVACPPSMNELRKLYRILITVPVTSAEAERTFSKLALIKSKLRTTCGQERLEKLVVCSVERDLVQQADVDKIIDRFSSLAENRRIVLN